MIPWDSGERRLGYLFIGIAAGALGIAAIVAGLFLGIDRFFQDRLFVSRSPDPRIIILAIDEQSLATYGQWPWPRKTWGEIVTALNTLSPAVIGIDVNFPEASRLGAADDKAFLQSLKESKTPIALIEEASPLLLDSKATAATTIRPLAPFREHALLGYANVIADGDGVVRRFPPEVSEDEEAGRHFTLAILERAGLPARVPNTTTVFINFAGTPGTFPQESLALLQSPITTRDLAEKIKGKLVIIGATAESLQDAEPVPTSHGELMAGAEIHANILDTILSGKFLEPLSASTASLLAGLMGILPALLFLTLQGRRIRTSLPVLVSLATLAAFIASAAWFFEIGTILPIAAPTLAWLISSAGSLGYRSLTEEREKRRIRETFSRYVSPAVLEVILAAEKDLTAGERRMATIMFTDLEGFTSISSRLTPEHVIELLGVYFGTMTPIVKRSRGIVDKYIGDAILAFWCEPFVERHSADQAVRTAIEMLEAIPAINRELSRRNLPSIKMRIGVNTGNVIVGNVGSEERLDFTVIGDAVNVASRLEKLNKEFETELLISGTTYEELEDRHGFEKFSGVTVRGKTETIEVYGYRSSAS